MRAISLARVCLSPLLFIGSLVPACSSSVTPDDAGTDSAVFHGGSSGGSSSGAVASSSGSSSGATGSSSGSSSSGSSGGTGSSSSSSSSSGGVVRDASVDATGGPLPSDGGTGTLDSGACLTGLQDKTTTCTGTEPTCAKACGPDLAVGNLGSKACSCNAATLVYNCLACVYPQPLPSCYAPPLNASGLPAPPACAAGVADKVTCTTPCSGVCTFVTDAGKTDGCVCVQHATGTTQWSCQTQWW